MAQTDWSRFAVRINIAANAEDIFNSWMSQQALEDWFLRLAEFRNADGNLRKPNEKVQPGDQYTWRWHGYPDEVLETGEILEVQPNESIRFSFGNAGICTFSVKETEGEKVAELLQENIPTDEKSMINFHVGCKTGWTFYLANLKSILEGGVDLRNKNEKLTEMLNS